MTTHRRLAPIALLATLLTCGCAREDIVSSPTAAAVIPVTPATPMDAAAARQTHEVTRGADGLFYVNARVNGRTVRLLVDTGASVVVLTEADARAVGLDLDDGRFDRSVKTVGGNTAMAWATLDHVHLAGHDVRGVKAGVVRSGLGVSLLGQNLLAHMDSVTISADRLSLR